MANDYLHLLTDVMNHNGLKILSVSLISQSYGNSEYAIQDGWWTELFFL